MVKQPKIKQDFSAAIRALDGRDLNMIRLEPVCKGSALRFSDTAKESSRLTLTVPAADVGAFCEEIKSSDLHGTAILVTKIESASRSLSSAPHPV